MDSQENTVLDPVEQKLLVMENWEEARFPAALDEQGDIYLPVRSLCQYLGISHQMQIKTLRSRKNTSRYIRQFNLRSPRGGGKQPTWCLHIRAVAFWLGGFVDVDHVKPELQEGLLAWQDTLLRAAHALFFHQSDQAPQLTAEELQHRLLLAEAELQRLRFENRIHSRRLATIEKHTLPPHIYFDLDDPEDDDSTGGV